MGQVVRFRRQRGRRSEPRARFAPWLPIGALLGIGLIGAYTYGLPGGSAEGMFNRLTTPDRDCADFATQAEAQAFFRAQGPGDRHRLDEDGDGRACELNP
jgi:Excalibur calcium-binding domain